MVELYEKSIQILLEHQDPGGAFLACPTFDTYRYAWFRDGSFCAYALHLAGHPEPARRFHRWAANTVLRYQTKIEDCIQKAQIGAVPPEACFHSRFTVTGEEIPGHWGNHQLDGLGAWLWALGAYPELASELRPAIELVRDYLTALWKYPCSDCWEENEDLIHPYSLSAIHAGLLAADRVLGVSKSESTCAEIRAFLRMRALSEGRLVKSIGDPAVDASLLGAIVPFAVFPPDDPIVLNTLSTIRSELRVDGSGMHRYRKDTYYGGGEWVLLTAWLGWVDALRGDLDEALAIKAWVEQQATPALELPEQVFHVVNDPAYLPVWEKRWGKVATPLLWSHAKYIILENALRSAQRGA